MMAVITIPREAVPYMLLQRLEVQELGAKIHYSILGKWVYKLYEKTPGAKHLYRIYSMKIEPMFRFKRIIEKYVGVMYREFQQIAPYLPENANKIIGIGPGVGGLEAYMSRYYSTKGLSPEITLIDKSRIDDIYYGFHEEAAAYNSLDIARSVLIDNGHLGNKIICIEADDLHRFDVYGVDLITSLLAWGFHFPVGAYLDFAFDALRTDGRLIMDVRKETDGLEELEKKFGAFTIILDDPKFDRVLAVKK